MRASASHGERFRRRRLAFALWRVFANMVVSAKGDVHVARCRGGGLLPTSGCITTRSAWVDEAILGHRAVRATDERHESGMDRGDEESVGPFGGSFNCGQFDP